MNLQRLVLDLASFTLLSGLALACSSGVADDGGTDEGATVVEPNGTDLGAGTLVVAAPSDDALEKTEYDLKSPFGHAAPVTHALGQSVTGLATGSYPVTLRTEGPTYSVTTRRDVQVDAGKTATVNAGLLAIDARTAGLRIFGLGSDGGGDIAIRTSDNTDVGHAKSSADGTTFAALLGDRVKLSWGFGDGTLAGITPGGKTTVVLRSAADRGRAHLVAYAGPRTFPSYACGSPLGPDEYVVTTSDQVNKATIKLADGETIEFGVEPHSIQAFYVETAALRKFGPLRFGAPAVTNKMGRIDVDDVLVNGTQRVKGKYMIAKSDGSAWLTRCELPTKTGLDIPFGKYLVSVRYQTVEAGEKKEEYIVDVN